MVKVVLGEYKKITNGYRKASTGKVAEGGIVQNEEAKMVYVYHEFCDECTSFVAELKALHWGLVLHKRRQSKPLQVDTDCLSLANIVQKKNRKGPGIL